MTRELKVVSTTKGHNALWEYGGICSTSGFALIICGQNGEKLRPYYVSKTKQNYTNHVLLPIKEQYFIIETLKESSLDIKVSIITSIKEFKSCKTVKRPLTSLDPIPKTAYNLIYKSDHFSYTVETLYRLCYIEVVEPKDFLKVAIDTSIKKASINYKISYHE